MKSYLLAMAVLGAGVSLLPAFLKLPNRHYVVEFQNSQLVEISFACPIAAAFPLLVDMATYHIASIWSKNKSEKNIELLVVERLLILISMIIPSIGHFAVTGSDSRSISTIYYILACVQNSLFGGTFLSILHHFSPRIWNVNRTLFLILFFQLSVIFSQFYSPVLSTVCGCFIGVFCIGIGYCYLRNCSILFSQIMHPENSVLNDTERNLPVLSLFYATAFLAYLLTISIIPTRVHELTSGDNRVVFTNLSTLLYLTSIVVLPRHLYQIAKKQSDDQLKATESFVLYIGHELRTPLNCNAVGLDVLERTLGKLGCLTTLVKQILIEIRSGSDCAVKILDDILNFERITSRSMSLEKTKERPVKFIHSCFRTFLIQAKAKSITLDIFRNLDPTVATILSNKCIDVDVQKVAIVFRNLASNALKFTPEGGTVSVQLKVDTRTAHNNNSAGILSRLLAGAPTPKSTEDWLVISVVDTGAGIAQESIPRLFREVVQFDANALQDGMGSGFGLVITKGIVDLHGGKILASSPGVGQGAMFTVELPLLDMPAKPDSERFNPNSGTLSALFNQMSLSKRMRHVSRVFPDIIASQLENGSLSILPSSGSIIKNGAQV